MSVKTEQRLGYSVRMVDVVPTNDGAQSLLQTGFKNIYVFWAWFVNQEELNDTISGALPPEYALEGEPSVQEISNIRHYNVQIRGVSWTDEPLQPVHESECSGNFS
jgi:hypothetical protein